MHCTAWWGCLHVELRAHNQRCNVALGGQPGSKQGDRVLVNKLEQYEEDNARPVQLLVFLKQGLMVYAVTVREFELVPSALQGKHSNLIIYHQLIKLECLPCKDRICAKWPCHWSRCGGWCSIVGTGDEASCDGGTIQRWDEACS